MSDDITLKLPDAQSFVLHKLYAIKEAVLSKSWDAALLHCNDSITRVQNEIDWSYQTDPILPFIREFLMELQGMLRIIEGNVTHVPALLRVILSTMTEVTQVSSALPTWNAPDEHIDLLEVEHRTQLYAKG